MGALNIDRVETEAIITEVHPHIPHWVKLAELVDLSSGQTTETCELLGRPIA